MTAPGRELIVAAWVGTGVFVVTAVLATLFESMRPVGVVSALVWFALGCVAFLWAFALAVDRSRTELLGVGGIYFLAGCAPNDVRWHLMGATAVQAVVALTTASLRPFTSVAFGILVPMYGLGVAGIWAARHGVFPDRNGVVAAADPPENEDPS